MTTPKYALSVGWDECHLIEHVMFVPSKPYPDHPTKGAKLKQSEKIQEAKIMSSTFFVLK